MKVIDSNILALTRDGKIISFDNREEYDNSSIVDLNIFYIIASPQDFVRRFKELDDKVEELEKKIYDEN